ncbi:hypothetical protein BH24ACI3_BH24ACI3_16450 [soil metagenome]
MKVLIAYDGSRCSEAALDDLVSAGLPESCEALVISVAEVWLPPPDGDGNITGTRLQLESGRSNPEPYETDKRIVAGAETLAYHANKRLRQMFPRWQVTAQATFGSPAWSILKCADEFKPNLIVVGAHGSSPISRFFLGSISQKVVTEAHCSVRVSRGRIEVDSVPVRIVIGFDGSKGSLAAVDEVASRPWRDYSEIRLIAATKDVRPSAIGRFIPPAAHMVEEVNESERQCIEKLAANPLIGLQRKNISAALHFCAGNPKHVLVEQAENWNADCIFVGANAFASRLERFLLGSTSAAVAARAHCSVEVVRREA